MKITLNGEQAEVAEQTSLLDLLEVSGYKDRRVAVEINRRIVPRSAYAEQQLQPDDRIEIVHAIGGG